MGRTGSSSVSVQTLNSTVTKLESAGTVKAGPIRRSQRAGSLLGNPSFAFVWNAALEVLPQKELLVVHGTGFTPRPCTDVQPAGITPGATSSKVSDNRTVFLPSASLGYVLTLLTWVRPATSVT